jgi:DUF4097 and DUF4098 domain-containing protein YvlB
MLSEWMALTLLTAPLLGGGLGHAEQRRAGGGGERVDARRAADPDGVVEIDGAGGAIRIIGWDKPEVHVTGTLGDGAEGLSLDGTSRRIRIDVETEGNPHSVVSNLEIRVPAGSRIEVDAMSADITVLDVTGTVTADTVAGSIGVTGSAREVTLESVNGSVDVACACARAHVESVNGSITVKGARGEVEASTVNGSLDVTGGSFERARLETVNGRITFDGELQKRATLEVESVGGSVELRLPATTAADFTINTFSGSIRNGLGGQQPRNTSRFTSEKELVFTAGAGGATVTIQTLSGDVIVSKR